jgi:acyl-coenzyme A synthetase/AMP-(fatty) acid ligase
VNPVERFFASAEAAPDAPAIVSRGGTLKFGDVADTVRRMASKLEQSGVSQGSVVGVNARPEMEAVATLALMQLGAVSMRVSETILRGYRDSIDLVLSDTMARGAGDLPVIDLSLEFVRSLAGVAPRDGVTALGGEEVVRVVFSSGTTGTPKGVPFTADYLTARVDSARRNWIPQVPFMSLLGLDTVTGYQTFMWAMMNGETYFTVAGAPENFALISENKVAAIKTSPARLADLLVEAERAGKPQTALAVVEVAGSLIPSKTVTECQMFFGVTPTYLYGSTEVGTVTRGAVDTTTPSMVGTIVDEIDVEIVNDNGEPVESGSEGILRFRKEGMPSDYWNSPTVSASSGFRDGWFYPGDYGRIDPDNRLWLSGRRDDLVNAGGAKFNLIELDHWLVESGLFLDAASFQFTTETGVTSIGVAFVTKHPPEPSILRERLKDFLPDLTLGKLLRVEEIPRNQLGKIERVNLASLSHTSKGNNV